MAAVVRPRLEELPEELVSNIVVKLDSDSSFAFRLTCRALEQKSLHEWASEYFSHKAIIPTSSSLKLLASVAESEKLRNYIHQIYILPALFSDQVFNCCHGKHCKWKHTVRQEEAMHGYVQDQKELKQNGQLEERLTRIFKLLPELHSIMFTDGFNNVPAEVDIHGHASFTRRTNNTLSIKPTNPEDRDFYAWKAYVWKAMMQAIAFSGIGTLQNLYCGLDSVTNPLTLNDLNFAGRTLHHLGKTLHGIEGLRLQMTSSTKSIVAQNEHFDKYKALKVMKSTAQLVPSVSYLDLTFFYDSLSSIMCRTFIDNITLSNLNKLRLNDVFLESKFLGTLIYGLTNAETLFLEYIQLTKGTWPTVLQMMLKLKKLKHLHLTSIAVPSGTACFLKALDPKNGPRNGGSGGWDSLNLFGGGTGQGAAGAGAHAPDGFDFLIDGDDYYDDYDSGDEDDSEDDDNDDSGGTMPELEPPTRDLSTNATAQAPLPLQTTASAPNPTPQNAQAGSSTLAQTLYSPYSDSDGETDEDMPDLEPNTGNPSQPQASTPTNNNNSSNGQSNQTNHRSSTARPTAPDPGSLEARLGQGIDRGRVVCLNTAKEIREQLPRFIKEYHIVDENVEDDMFGGLTIPLGGGAIPLGGGAGTGGGFGQGAAGGAGPAPPAAVTNMLNALFQPGNGGHNAHGPGFALHGPFFGPPPPPAGQNAGANGAAAPTNPHATTVESDEGSAGED